MAVLCKLADPKGYQPYDWSITADADDFAYWTQLFLDFPTNIKRHMLADNLGGGDFDTRWPVFYEEYCVRFNELREHPERFDTLTTITLCMLRQEMLNKHGFNDPFEGVKRKENALAAELYSARVAEIDSMPESDRWMELVRGMLAGNLFDLGAPATAEMYHAGEIDFHVFLDQLAPRPWRVDGTDPFIAKLKDGCDHIVIFVDNSGADIVLGVVPMARELARHGTTVTLASNTEPALNDVIHREMLPLLVDLAARDTELTQLLNDRKIRAVASGNDIPLIDLGRVSDECNEAAADCDMIVLQGMGRGVESNWRQEFTCDIARIALLKDDCVVKWMKGQRFDPVCRFDAANGR